MERQTSGGDYLFSVKSDGYGHRVAENVGLCVAYSLRSTAQHDVFEFFVTKFEPRKRRENMRDRSLTPYFPLPLLGFESPPDPQGVSARYLEGQIIGNGRFLLMEKTDHTEDSARFVAKDMIAGIDVELEVHRCDERGFRLGASDTSDESAELDLWNSPATNQESGDIAKPHGRVRRVLKRITGMLRTAR